MFVSEFSRSRKFVLFDGLVVCVLRLLVENTKGLDWIDFACEISKSLSDLNDRMLVKWGSYRTRIVFRIFSLISIENWTFDRLKAHLPPNHFYQNIRMAGDDCGVEVDKIDWDTEDELEIESIPLASHASLTFPSVEANMVCHVYICSEACVWCVFP
ncbi:hypothetical protein SDJN02_16455, partial [Cucurbita argyrosperma subsp. argyrosperma]